METKNRVPGAVNAAAYKEMSAAVRALWDAQERKAPAAELCKLSLRADAATRVCNELEQKAREAFAKFRGWKYDKKLWVHVEERGEYGRRIVKHPEFYRDANTYEVVGLVSHTDATREEVARFAAKHNYIAEVFPWSWNAPGVYKAVLFTLKAGATWAVLRTLKPGATWPK
jgi:hypothetical protein